MAITTAEQFDFVVAGAGSAGAVLANRLTADGRSQVLLVEAGRDVVPGAEPADIRSLFPLSTFNEDYVWRDLRGHWRRQENSPAVRIQQGRLMGGGSAIMGMWAMRGHPDDYDGWARAGAAGWSWRDVLPYFRRLENDLDFDDAMHGRDGPIPIRRDGEDSWSPFSRAVRDATLRAGYRQVVDMNGTFEDGHCVLPVSRYEKTRASAGISYLTEEVRRRPNLTILCDATVTSLVLDGRVVRGVRVSTEAGDREVHARETILACGALQTPGLLQRAGIGDAGELREAGIDVVHNLPGVGGNLQNHAILYALAFLKRGHSDERRNVPPASTFIRWTTGEGGAPASDMALYVRSYLMWHALGRRMAMLAPVLMRPASRGRVRPRPGDAAPLIEFNLLGEEIDMRRMIDGVRRAARLFDAPEVVSISGPSFVLENAARLMKYNAVRPLNALIGRAAATLVDAMPDIGRRALSRFADFVPLDGMMKDEQRLRDYVRASISGTFHVCGTCRMGDPDDPDAVVDPHGRVLGLGGLRVADASVMPDVPAANTHIPVVMVAEKLADAIRSRSGEGVTLETGSRADGVHAGA